MKNINVNNGTLSITQTGLGCMRIADMELSAVDTLVKSTMEAGINFFDHADIYGGGRSEEVFSQAIGMDAKLREKMIIQSKCGIRDGFFDFSYEHIINSVDGILSRLDTDYLDILLLHRPDTLVEPEEVAKAFDELKAKGKVKHFGVSNQNPMQISLLKKYLNVDILFNQLQLSVARTGMIDAGLNVNMKVDASFDHDGSVLDYCRLNDITIQAWSPFQYGFFEGVFFNSDKYLELNKVIDILADKYGVTREAIAIAWIHRHPAKIQAIVGTTNVDRVKGIALADKAEMTRKEWYEIYRAAGNVLP